MVHLSASALIDNSKSLSWARKTLGTVVGRYESVIPGAPALLIGSHIDTVRDAGRYDGTLGVVAEAFARAHREMVTAVLEERADLIYGGSTGAIAAAAAESILRQRDTHGKTFYESDDRPEQ